MCVFVCVCVGECVCVCLCVCVCVYSPVSLLVDFRRELTNRRSILARAVQTHCP